MCGCRRPNIPLRPPFPSWLRAYALGAVVTLLVFGIFVFLAGILAVALLWPDLGGAGKALLLVSVVWWALWGLAHFVAVPVGLV